MNLNDQKLEECQRALHATCTRILAVTADIAEVNRGVRSWVRLREDLALLAASVEGLNRLCGGLSVHVNDVILRYSVQRKSLRTGVPVNELISHIARKMAVQGK